MTKDKIELECGRLTVPHRSRRNKIDARCHKIGNGNNKQLKAVCLSVAGGLLLGMLALFRPSTDLALQQGHERGATRSTGVAAAARVGATRRVRGCAGPRPAGSVLPHLARQAGQRIDAGHIEASVLQAFADDLFATVDASGQEGGTGRRRHENTCRAPARTRDGGGAVLWQGHEVQHAPGAGRGDRRCGSCVPAAWRDG